MSSAYLVQMLEPLTLAMHASRLSALLQHPSVEVRREVSLVMTRLPGDVRISLARCHLDSPHDDVRRSALGNILSMAPEDELRACYKEIASLQADQNDAIRQLACRGLPRIAALMELGT